MTEVKNGDRLYALTDAPVDGIDPAFIDQDKTYSWHQGHHHLHRLQHQSREDGSDELE